MSKDSRRSDREEIQLKTHRGTESTPWQFSLTRTPEEIVIEQARGPPERFEPVEKRFTIEPCELGSTPLTFELSVSRRVWQEDPDQPHVRSQRSQGRRFDILYRDADGWHMDRPEPQVDGPVPETDGEVVPTTHPGISVQATYFRSELANEVKFTEVREYYVDEAVFIGYHTVYILSYDEVNEESEANLQWDVYDAVAYELVA